MIEILRIRFLWFCWALLGAVAIANAAGEPRFRIDSYATHESGKIVYHYRFTNLSADFIGGVSLGLHENSDPSEGPIGDLAELPSGTKYGDVYHLDGYDVLLNPASTSQPSGWIVEYGEILEDDADGDPERGGFYLIWRATDPARVIKAGQTLDGFSVTLDKPDHKGYLTGRSSVGIQDASGRLSSYSIRATPIDTTVPELSVKPLPSSVSKLGGTSLKVQTVITISDDYDPQPEIKLESITASVPVNASEIKGAVFGTDDRLFVLPNKKDPTGKPVIYTITYSATDGTGNKATQSATVTLNP